MHIFLERIVRDELPTFFVNRLHVGREFRIDVPKFVKQEKSDRQEPLIDLAFDRFHFRAVRVTKAEVGRWAFEIMKWLKD